MPPIEIEKYLEVLQPDRCPLCFLTHQYGHEHLRSLLEESVTDPASRKQLFESGGFCRHHAWKAVQSGKILGMAILYASLLEKGLKDLGGKGAPRSKPCPICESEKKYEQNHARQFAEAWAQSEQLRESFHHHGVLCLTHLGKALGEMKNGAQRKTLYESAKKALEPLLKDLNEFLEKQDYHRSHESFGKERDAWVRVVRMVSGERD
jgi:hypothetical protein